MDIQGGRYEWREEVSEKVVKEMAGRRYAQIDGETCYKPIFLKYVADDHEGDYHLLQNTLHSRAGREITLQWDVACTLS